MLSLQTVGNRKWVRREDVVVPLTQECTIHPTALSGRQRAVSREAVFESMSPGLAPPLQLWVSCLVTACAEAGPAVETSDMGTLIYLIL